MSVLSRRRLARRPGNEAAGGAPLKDKSKRACKDYRVVFTSRLKYKRACKDDRRLLFQC